MFSVFDNIIIMIFVGNSSCRTDSSTTEVEVDDIHEVKQLLSKQLASI